MSGFILRWVLAFILLAATYNPTTYNYITWAQANFETDNKALVVGIGVMLGLAILMYLVTMLRTMGLVGLVLVVIILGLLAYILQMKGVIDTGLTATNIWGGLAVISLLLAIATSMGGSSKKKATSKASA
ncbi:DUF6524 family protein [Rhodovulum euryhalinum]|uniref:Uncharacterized protein n=1 Tax=Rhodovulum euryhalinum TaxID=35805 RepID=A0A4V2SAA3_9RHOB|nr:DUF6524 family protein [Rhodovulum euryhalinum]TCO70860.1 hypothetical protein EV655_108101 [Rhodovulum euryhalinum]